MRVIKAGFNVNSWKQEIHCEHCNAELEIDVTDVETEIPNQRDYDSKTRHYTKCPNCKSLIYLFLPREIEKYL